jgi:sulfur carrier protein ThiS adenylyltransferase
MYKTDAIREIIREIAPYGELETYTIRLTEENAKNILRNAHVVCEAFDDAEEKSMLANIVLSQMKDKYLVSSSGMAGLGSGNKIHTRRITSRFYLCGDEESDVSGGIGLISSRVMICAAHQAHTVLRILAKEFEE